MSTWEDIGRAALGIGGTIAGGLIGGPVGAGVGGSLGGVAGQAIWGDQESPAQRRQRRQLELGAPLALPPAPEPPEMALPPAQQSPIRGALGVSHMDKALQRAMQMLGKGRP